MHKDTCLYLFIVKKKNGGNTIIHTIVHYKIIKSYTNQKKKKLHRPLFNLQRHQHWWVIKNR